jgi:hypothetical protein
MTPPRLLSVLPPSLLLAGWSLLPPRLLAGWGLSPPRERPTAHQKRRQKQIF